MGFIEDRNAYKILRSPSCPRVFHEMSSIFELGVAVGPRVHMDFGPGPVYLAPKMLAVAGSSREKKTTGYLRPSITLLDTVIGHFKGADLPYTALSNTSTPEGLFDALEKSCPVGCERSSMYWTIDEYSRFFASTEKGYMSDAVESVLVAMDGYKDTRGLAGGKTKAHGEVNLSMLTATVRESYERCAHPWHFTSGFVPRHMVRIGSSKYHVRPKPVLTPDFVTPLSSLITSYYQPSANDTIVEWDTQAEKSWENWCRKNDKLGANEESAVQVIRARAEDHLVMLAMAYAISDRMTYSPKIVLTRKDFRLAARRVAPYIEDAISLARGCGQRHVVAVRRILTTIGGPDIPWHKASKMFTDGNHGDLEDFELAIKTLEDQSEITVRDNKHTGGRPARLINRI